MFYLWNEFRSNCPLELRILVRRMRRLLYCSRELPILRPVPRVSLRLLWMLYLRLTVVTILRSASPVMPMVGPRTG